MSRLIIKNLPRHTTPAHLRTHFSQSSGPGGTITDVKVALKPDGTSRRFGFVGYKTEKEAEAAKNWFDGTFLGEAKMQVGVVDVNYSFLLFFDLRYFLMANVTFGVGYEGCTNPETK